MTTLKLLKNHRLKADSRQWIFQKSSGVPDSEGNINWHNIGYYSTLSAAVNAAYGYFIRKSDADDATSLLAEAKRILTELSTALTPTVSIKENK